MPVAMWNPPRRSIANPVIPRHAMQKRSVVEFILSGRLGIDLPGWNEKQNKPDTAKA